MQDGFPYIDILIFGVIAIFLIFRLKNVLGTKTSIDDSNIKKEKYKKEFSNIIQLNKKENYNDLTDEIDNIKKVDSSFDVNEFLSGSQIFFKMVLDSFVSGDLNNIKSFIKPSVFQSFQKVIFERNKEQETLIIDLKSVKKNVILFSKITKKSIKISVAFESLQIKALIDKDNKVIDGNIDKEILVKDIWVFEREINFDNPNWTLVETKSY
jgi:predicted lipid-binding transport protein (Tim44 family)